MKNLEKHKIKVYFNGSTFRLLRVDKKQGCQSTSKRDIGQHALLTKQEQGHAALVTKKYQGSMP